MLLDLYGDLAHHHCSLCDWAAAEKNPDASAFSFEPFVEVIWNTEGDYVKTMRVWLPSPTLPPAGTLDPVREDAAGPCSPFRPIDPPGGGSKSGGRPVKPVWGRSFATGFGPDPQGPKRWFLVLPFLIPDLFQSVSWSVSQLSL